MKHLNNVASQDDYIKAITTVIGEEAHITRAKSGLVNAVFLVDERYVFRFPRDETVYKQQIFERDVCTYLAGHAQQLPFKILEPVNISADHSFVYKYIPGEIMNEQEMLGLGSVSQQVFVQDLLLFVNWLGNVLSPAKYKELVEASDGTPIEHWENYIERTVGQFNNQEYPALTEVCQELLSEMNIHYPDGITTKATRVIHDDLHMGNLLFIDGKLSGVIDFGNIMIGDLACEFRHFYRLSPDLAKQAVEIYKKKYGEEADLKKIAWWARLNDAATIVDKIVAGKIGSPAYERALINLSKWYPKKNW